MAAPLTPYELERQNNIAANRQLLQNLGVDDAVRNLGQSLAKKCIRRRDSVPKQAASTIPVGPTRRSNRVGNKAPAEYRELSDREVFLVEGPQPKRRRNKSADKSELPTIAYGGPEQYTEEHEKALGSYEKEWECYVDGFGADRKRVYDNDKGKTCHQCRQKTLGLRTECTRCHTLNGQFCGDCLFMRYGENVLEANANPDWECPSCRDLCNCSICRNRKGWGPTGQLYWKAINQGHKSVAHYLVATRRAPPVALDTANQPTTEHFPAAPVTPVEDFSATGSEGSALTMSPIETPQKARPSDASATSAEDTLLFKSPTENETAKTAFLVDAPQKAPGLKRLRDFSPVTARSGITTGDERSNGSPQSRKPLVGGSDPKQELTHSTPVSQIGREKYSRTKSGPGNADGQIEPLMMEINGGGSSPGSCESGLSSEGGNWGPREILERKFRSLEEITTGDSQPGKRRRGERARKSSNRFVECV